MGPVSRDSSEELLGISEMPFITRIQSGFQDVSFPFYR